MAARDIILIGVIVFFLGTGFFILHNVMGKVVDTMTNSTGFNESSMAVDALDDIKNVTNKLDYVVFVVFIGSCLALIIGGFLVGGLPVFMFIYFLVIIIGVVLSVILSNVWESITTNAALTATLASFPICNHLLLHLPIYTAVVGFVGIVAMFAKPFALGGE